MSDQPKLAGGHHGSCRESDKDLIWYCNQCGLRESAADIEQQLADERERVQTYEDALIKIANDPNCDRCQVAVDALARVGK